MSFFLSAIVLVCSLLMFIVRKEQKLCVLAIYLICLKNVSSLVLPATITPPFTFLLSEIPHFKQYWRLLKEYSLCYPFVIIVFSLLVLYLHSPHLVGFRGLWTIFNNGFIQQYGVLFISFLAALNMRNSRSFIKISLLCLCILTFFGILNLITKHAIFVDWATYGTIDTISQTTAGTRFMDSDRFRVQAMFKNPFDYGYTCLVLLLLFEYFRRSGRINKLSFSIGLICCLFGIISCGARTLLAVTIIGGLVYLIFGFNFKKQISIILIGGLMLLIFVLYVPGISEKLSFLASAFSDNSSIGGSDISMRQTQLLAVLYQIRDDLLLGKGFGYFSIDMGWSEGYTGLVDKDLFGIEGVYLSYLLERGAFGLIMYTLFWISVIIFVFKISKRTKERIMKATCLAIIAAYLGFANMTGELGSVPITDLALGIIMGYTISEKYGTKATLPVSLTKAVHKNV